ncbi:MAG: recombinase family protein [Acetobacteraceae bacterium]|jgi:DNA invertase Pin-like site-specific DNA recombinase|nr:recombinase family protein [Acetobacteraceae bacterium]
MRLIGYARVSTGGQDLAAQREALRAAGCVEVIEETGSGGDRSRPALASLLGRLRRGDTLVVARIDRLARSLAHLLEVIGRLEARGVGFRSLGDPIDTAGPSGTLVLQILGAVAEFERALIRERTLAGLAAARARGRVGGNPRLKARDPAALARLQASRRAATLARALPEAELWIGHVRRLRPAMPWRGVEDRVNAALPAGTPRFRPGRIVRLAKLFVGEGLLEPTVLAPAPRRRRTAGEGRRAVEMAAACLRGRPRLTLAALGEELLRLGVAPPRGGGAWAPSSLKALVARAREEGLLG